MTEATAEIVKEEHATQGELALAMVEGQPYTTLPEDLYIPPDALEVILEAFEGPLDLLLYLIKRQNLDILNIPIAGITAQYMEYIDLMQELRLELAAEYLLMAAMLAEIKSRMLLPRHHEDEEDENDPRAELVRRLQEYERFKQAAEDIDSLPREGRDTFMIQTQPPEVEQERPLPTVVMKDLMHALRDVMKRAELNASHHIQRESLSIRERMTTILSRIQESEFASFESFFKSGEGRLGVVVTFIAILELVKQSMIQIVQTENYGSIHIKVAG